MTNTVYANLVTWKLKSDMEEEWLKRIDETTDKAKNTQGFKGIFAFESVNEPNTVYILSLWDSEESLDAAMQGIVKDIWDKLGDMATERPSAKKLRGRELAAQMVSIPA